MRACYCGKCEMPFITCSQWDCPGATRSMNTVHHPYDCEFCENRKRAYRQKLEARERERNNGRRASQASTREEK